MTGMKIFVGYDTREKVAYDVLKHSIEKNTRSKINIIPLYHKELRKQGYFKRPWLTNAIDGNSSDLIDGKPFSTEFSHTRFLIPQLCGFKGWALFMDCDMVFKCDVKEIFELADERYAAMVVKHRQKVDTSVKMDGSVQTNYYRKNWSSFVLWNCGHEANRCLTTDTVNVASGGWLHAFSWLDDSKIGELPKDLNWIEGSSPGNVNPKVVHYTMGGPWFSEYKDVLHNEAWWDYYRSYHHELPDPSITYLEVDYSEFSK